MKNNIAIELNKVSIVYNNAQNVKLALEDISFSIEEGSFLGIIGPNGGGKSTLLKGILGFLPLKNGEISIYGQPRGTLSGVFGYVPQIIKIDRNFPISVHEVVLSGLLKGKLHPFFKFSKQDKEKVDFFLEKTGIADLKKRQISELSGGEFQKLLIARALALNPKILLLDEPTANIAPVAREKIYTLLKDLNKDMTIVLVTHDLSVVKTDISELVCINKSLVYHGEPVLTDEILKNI